MVQDLETVNLAEKALREQEKKIQFKVKPFRVADLVQKFDKEQFYIPDYQREDVWSYSMKSKFIESILLGLPIPDMFVCETKENDENFEQVTQFEVIDGSQRLRTLAKFVSNKFHLKNLEVIKELEGFHYSDLTDFRKDKFNDVTIDVIILHSDTSEDIRNAMFDRINTSNPLQAMELRRGSYTGPFNDLICECGEILKDKYQDICPISVFFKDRKEEEEFALRFFAFSETFDKQLFFNDTAGNKITIEEKGTNRFLTCYYDYQNQRLKNLEKDNKVAYKQEIDRLKSNFTDMLVFVKKNFHRGFRRDKSGSVSRVVFEAVSVGVHLALKKHPVIMEINVNTSWMKDDSTFKNSINQKYKLHTANKIIERITIVRDKLLNAQ